MTTHVNDAGTWRAIQQVQVNDGGVWRNIQQIYVNDGGTWRTVFSAAVLSATMTEGSAGGVFLGYIDGSIGSMDTVAFTDGSGNTLRAVFDDNTGNSYLDVYAATDPGATYVSSCEVAGVSKNTADATYSYGVVGATIARWLWPSTFGIDGSGTSTVVIAP